MKKKQKKYFLWIKLNTYNKFLLYIKKLGRINYNLEVILKNKSIVKLNK